MRVTLPGPWPLPPGLASTGPSWHHQAREIQPASCTQEAQKAVEREVQGYAEYYHYERPHLGLDMRTPLPYLSHLL